MKRPRHQHRNRHGMSLIEVSIAAIMASVLVLFASGVSIDLSRHIAGNLVDTRLSREARIITESLRRDLSGSSLDLTIGSRDQWRLVGTMTPTADELRLCFDASDDATADWVAPDLVVTYFVEGNRLVRNDASTGNDFTVSQFVDDFTVTSAGGRLTVEVELLLNGVERTVSVITEDVL